MVHGLNIQVLTVLVKFEQYIRHSDMFPHLHGALYDIAST